MQGSLISATFPFSSNLRASLFDSPKTVPSWTSYCWKGYQRAARQPSDHCSATKSQSAYLFTHEVNKGESWVQTVFSCTLLGILTERRAARDAVGRGEARRVRDRHDRTEETEILVEVVCV